MEKFNFILPLHKACSTSTTKGVPPSYKSIFFINGYAYATNGSILVKHPIRLCTILDHGEHLNNVGIPAKSYEQILTFDTAEVSQEGVNCSSEDGRTAFFEFTKIEGFEIPDFDKAIHSNLGRYTALDCIGVDPNLLETASKLLVGGQMGIKMQFTGIDKGIIITPSDDNKIDDQLVVVSPKIIQPTLFDNDQPGT